MRPCDHEKCLDGTVGVVISVKNGMKFFNTCFYSLVNFTSYPYALAVVDNQSDLKIKKDLRRMSFAYRFPVLRYDQDFNYAAQANLGLRVLFSNYNIKYGLLLNADTVVSPHWLGDLISVLENQKPLTNLGIVGPVTNIAIPEQQRGMAKAFEYTKTLSGFCMLFKREVFEKLGGFDERYELGCFEDQDFCARAILEGWNVGVFRGVHITHFWRGSRNSKLYWEAAKENETRFKGKLNGWENWLKRPYPPSNGTIPL